MSFIRRHWARPPGVAPLGRDARILIIANSLSALGTGFASPYLIVFLVRHQHKVGPAGYFLVLLIVDLVTQPGSTGELQVMGGL
jgi:hypothetical protein